METVVRPVRRKMIDIPEDIFRYLTDKATESGISLKNYIEALLIKEVEEMDDSKTYACLSRVRPEGHIMVDEQEKMEFEKWLGVEER